MLEKGKIVSVSASTGIPDASIRILDPTSEKTKQALQCSDNDL